MSRQSIIKAAFLLTFCGVICKLLGAFYRVPLTGLLTAEGMGMYYLVFPVFSFLISLTSSCVPQVLSKLVAESVSNNNIKKAKAYFLCSIVIFFVFSFLCSFLLVMLAPLLSKIQNNSQNVLSYIVIAPAVFLVAVISCFRGFFQGFQTMTYTGLSQIIEQIFKVVLGLFFANKFLVYGLNMAVFGALFAVTLSELFALLYLAFCYIVFKKKNKLSVDKSAKINYKQCYKDIIKTALPFTLSYVLFPLSQFVDSIAVVGLLSTSGLGKSVATSVFGLYNGVVATLTNLPIVVSTAIAMAVLPTISHCFKRGDIEGAKSKVTASFKFALYILIPCVVAFIIFPDKIIYLIFGGLQSHTFNELYVSSIMLILSSIGILYLGVFQISTAILQAENKSYVPVRSLAIGIILRAVVLAVLLVIPGINFYAIVIANVLCYVFVAMKNISVLSRDFEFVINYKSYFFVPIISTFFMVCTSGICLLILQNLFNYKIVCLLAFLLGGIVYLVSMFCFGEFRKKDMLQILKN